MGADAYRLIPPDRAAVELAIGVPGNAQAEADASPSPWHVPWGTPGVSDDGGIPRDWLARTFRFLTSGSTDVPAEWSCTGSRLAADAAQLATVPALHSDPQAVVAFAPPQHTYGACATVMLPALLQVPVWFWPSADHPPPPVDAERLLVVAIPWSFRILLRRRDWLRRFSQVSVLHSSAALPGDAAELHGALAGTGAVLTEIFGSTETGAVAHRSGWAGQGPWTLFDDVSFIRSAPTPGEEVGLAVSGPRLARDRRGVTAGNWEMDDLVEILDDRRFAFHGRRGRLVKINGVRHDLGLVEERLRKALPTAELVCQRVTDPLRGESFDVIVAAGPDLTPEAVRSAAARLGVSPREVRLVDRISHSAVGKPRQLQTEVGNDHSGL
jgi:acyl-coenzyme A synthetase/AMP-(fatty) acid ligase